MARITRFWHRYKWSYFFIAPSMILFFLFIGYPVLRAVVLAFQKVTLRSTEWAGLKNFVDVFSSRLFLDSMWHTFVYALFVVAAWIISSLAVAALLQPFSNRVQSLFRGAFYLPYVTSIIVISLVWIYIFQPEYGFFNWLLSLFGLPRVLWLQNPNIALWSLILSTILIIPGTGVVLYSASIGSIPRELYEAARVDGAGSFTRFRRITLPHLSPVTFFLLVTSILGSMQAFDIIRVMTQGGPLDSTKTMVYQVYEQGFVNYRVGAASTVATVLFVFLLVIISGFVAAKYLI